MHNPLVSVLMTSYNREKFITEAIESVLASTYTNFELIIVDDASKDNTVTIAKSFEKKDSRIKCFINDKNLGDYPNRNKAASYARGEFIMHVDSDDMILKDGIKNCINTILSFPNPDFGMYSFEKEKEPYALDSKQALQQHFLKKPFLMIGPGGTIIRRSFFERISCYPEKYGPANDLYFNLKACSSTSSIIMLPFEFLYYRRHEGQEFNNTYSYLSNNYTYLRDALEKLPLQLEKSKIEWLHKKNKRRFAVNLLKYIYKTKNLNGAREVVKKAHFRYADFIEGIFH